MKFVFVIATAVVAGLLVACAVESDEELDDCAVVSADADAAGPSEGDGDGDNPCADDESSPGADEEPAAEPTNNRAERALRPAVIARKLSCGNKTPRGKRCWEVLTSLTATAQQNSQDIVELIARSLSLQPQAG